MACLHVGPNDEVSFLTYFCNIYFEHHNILKYPCLVKLYQLFWFASRSELLSVLNYDRKWVVRVDAPDWCQIASTMRTRPRRGRVWIYSLYLYCTCIGSVFAFVSVSFSTCLYCRLLLLWNAFKSSEYSVQKYQITTDCDDGQCGVGLKPAKMVRLWN